MKAWIFLLGLVLVSLAVATAYAQLDLSWRNCPTAAAGESAATTNENFNCSTATTHQLHGTFRLPTALSVQVADIYLELEDESATAVPPFWRFDLPTSGTTGCNWTAVANHLSGTQSLSGGCATYPSFWGDVDAQPTAAVVGYSLDTSLPNRATLVLVIADGSKFVQQVDTYYLFHLNIVTSRAGQCSGCDHKVTLVWKQLRLEDGAGNQFTMLGPNSVSSCVTVNGASAGPCGVLPVRAVTWGRLKALYR